MKHTANCKAGDCECERLEELESALRRLLRWIKGETDGCAIVVAERVLGEESHEG